MLPHLPGLNGLVAGEAVQVPPSPRFNPPQGKIFHVTKEPSLRVLPSGTTAAQKSGLNYERRVHQELKSLFPQGYESNVSFSWIDDLGRRYCEMDGLLRLQGRLFCIEIKYQHMVESWWQLRKKYEPILAAWEGIDGDDLALLEICRSLDPTSPYPEKYTYVEELPFFLGGAKDGELGVFQWKL